MFDFINWFIENRNKPLGYIILAAFVFLIDRFGRKLITSQVKRLFKVSSKHELAAYEERQIRIEDKLDVLMQKEGIVWNVPILDERQQVIVTGSVPFSPTHSTISLLAQLAKKYTKSWRCQMSNINKGILIPLLSAIALFIKEAFGYEVSTEIIDMASNIILYLIMAAGLFMNFKKKKPADEEDKEMGRYYH